MEAAVLGVRLRTRFLSAASWLSQVLVQGWWPDGASVVLLRGQLPSVSGHSGHPSPPLGLRAGRQEPPSPAQSAPLACLQLGNPYLFGAILKSYLFALSYSSPLL